MARTGRVSDAYAIAWLDQLAADTTHLALMTQDPTAVADPLTIEPGGAYSRVSVTWLRSGRLIRNAALLAWAGVPLGTQVVAIAGFTAAFNGVLTFHHPIPPVVYTAAGGLTVPAQQLFVGVDA